MAQKAVRRLKPWQRFLRLADEDLLAFAVLYENGMMDRAFYHAQQAIEKYLKAFALKKRQAARESTAVYRSESRNKAKKKAKNRKTEWLFGHELAPLVSECLRLDSSFSVPATVKQLRRISSFEVMARYPVRKWKFSADDVELVARLAQGIRSDLGARDDYYPLAKGLRITRAFAAEPRTYEHEVEFLGRMEVQFSWGAAALALRSLWNRIFVDPESLIGTGTFRGRS